MKVLLILLPLLSVAYSISFYNVVVEKWEVWKLLHNKSYISPEEEKFRMKVYMENAVHINKHNHKAMKGEHNYFLKMNHFGDLLHHEFVGHMNGFRNDLRLKSLRKNENAIRATFIPPANVYLPHNVDWRTKGYVTPVKDQGQCGSCWAFSATGSLEGQHFRKTGNLTSLSEQNLLDCSRVDGNQGCGGGIVDFAFKYILENGGIDTEDSYPYEAKENDCEYTKSNKGAWDVGYSDVRSGDEKALKAAVGTVGPISVAIDAGHKSFQFYSHGIYYEPGCNPQNLDHAVLAVGYGTDTSDEEPLDYWLVKNSWSMAWGDNGYIKMARNKDNHCGIATAASYPLV